MPIVLNQAGYRHALSLIRQGKVNKKDAWSFSADDGNALLGDPPKYDVYKKWFLGHDTDANPETKEAWKYPFGKNGNVYRSGLIAIRQRAAQQGERDIFEAAGRLLELVDAKKQTAKALAFKAENDVPTDILLLPFGEVETTKGKYVVDEKAAALVLSIFREIGNDIVIDYEHQTLKDVQAPAAGWIKDLYVGEDGVHAKVEWTERAKQYIANKEYRYFSPVVYVDEESGRAIYIQTVALTNLPATMNAKPLINKQKEEEAMKKILEILGVSSEDEALKAIKAYKQKKDAIPKEILELLELKEDAGISEVKASILAFKQGMKTSNDLAKEVKELKEKLLAKETEEIVEMALKKGKITPAQKEWALDYARKDIEGFKVYVQKAPQIVPVGDGIAKPVKQNVDGLDDATIMIAKQMEISVDDIKKYALKEGKEG